MNRLSVAERAQIIACLVEGNSIRSTARLTGAARNTITTLLVNLGKAVSEYQDRTIRNLPYTRIECDEIWAFCYAKAKNVPEQYRGDWGYGDVWTWTAIDPDTKIIASWLVGWRGETEAVDFLYDLRSRLANRIQLTTDGHVRIACLRRAQTGRSRQGTRQDLDTAGGRFLTIRNRPPRSRTCPAVRTPCMSDACLRRLRERRLDSHAWRSTMS